MRKLTLSFLSCALFGCNIGDKLRDELQDRISEEMAKNSSNDDGYENDFEDDNNTENDDPIGEEETEEMEPEETEPEETETEGFNPMEGCDEYWSGGARYGELMSSEGEYAGVIWLDDRCSGYVELFADLRLWSNPILVVETNNQILATTQLVHGIYEYDYIALLWVPADHAGVPLVENSDRPMSVMIFDAGERVDEYIWSEYLYAP